MTITSHWVVIINHWVLVVKFSHWAVNISHWEVFIRHWVLLVNNSHWVVFISLWVSSWSFVSIGQFLLLSSWLLPLYVWLLLLSSWYWLLSDWILLLSAWVLLLCDCLLLLNGWLLLLSGFKKFLVTDYYYSVASFYSGVACWWNMPAWVPTCPKSQSLVSSPSAGKPGMQSAHWKTERLGQSGPWPSKLAGYPCIRDSESPWQPAYPGRASDSLGDALGFLPLPLSLSSSFPPFLFPSLPLCSSSAPHPRF
jgi:hypothetical protein